ncbi:T9SS type A sorting domain-containing protein [Taibaiella lutea]|uniref:T9SS type A sorting domain-containing protein n=1 Tax=Taibaiella lutea TaxID=2608001 RepID=A0A5M6CWZ2_9BACT|nr:LamG-like jellyroll fold domain-containing protein [Taibaiella lutea]KAA5537425.1 T9SS type A sorting domain-containing protein [Taibaiella lutea]
MRISFTLFCLLLCSNINAQTIYPSGVTNCIARYDFSTTQTTVTSLQDVSGNNNNSYVVQDIVPTTSWRNLPNKAMLFNGSSSYAIIPDAASLRTQAVTMVALVKLNGFYDGDCQFSQILTKGYPGYIPGQYALALTDDVYDHDCHSFSSTHQQLIGYFNESYTTPGMQPNPGNYVSTGKWYFLAISFDGPNLSYYQVPMDAGFHYNNIAPIYSASNIPNSMGVNTQDITIGRTFNPPFPYWFNGAMDEIVLFNKILNTKEIQSVYDYLWNDGAPATVSTVDIKNQISDFVLYPNPGNGSFTITANTTFDNGELPYQIINTLGQVIYSGLLTADNGIIKQNISIPKDVAKSGTYVFVVNQAGIKVVKTFTLLKN